MEENKTLSEIGDKIIAIEKEINKSLSPDEGYALMGEIIKNVPLEELIFLDDYIMKKFDK